jgi:hypothetical protein
MTAKVFNIISYVVAGFFVYGEAMLAFFVAPKPTVKLVMMLGFLVPALIALFVGFALDGFRHKLRDTGIVLLASTGFSAFGIFSFACLMGTDDFKKMMKPGSLEAMSDYPAGFGLLVLLFTAGFVALRLGLRRSVQPTELALGPDSLSSG